MRGATRRAFKRLIDLALEKRVDFVVISGDLYDGDCRDFNTGLYLTRQLGRLRDERVPVFIIGGNHDAANKMTRVLPLPENVHILSHDHPETLRVNDLDVAIHGQSFAKAAVTENLAAAYPAPVAGCINIGLLHTGLGGADGHERYAPCTVEELRSRRYDYWALGHIHARQVVSNDPPIVFSGNVQGRHVRESGPKGCMIATIRPDHRIEPVFHRLDQVRWERAQVDVAGTETESDLLDRTTDVLDALLASEPEPDGLLAVRVILSGTTMMHGRLCADPERIQALVRSLAADRGGERIWIEKVELKVNPPRGGTMVDGPIEELLEVLDQYRTEPGSLETVIEELADLKRRLPPELAGDPDSPRLGDDQWLRTRLGQVQPFLLDLLVKSEGGMGPRRLTEVLERSDLTSTDPP